MDESSPRPLVWDLAQEEGERAGLRRVEPVHGIGRADGVLIGQVQLVDGAAGERSLEAQEHVVQG